MLSSVEISILLLIGSYALFTLVLTYYWHKTPRPSFTPVSSSTTVTVIIPVRNEAEGIADLLQDLEKQTYSSTLMEVIVVDDSSTDSTVKVVNTMISRSKANITLIQLPPSDQITSPKKRAINSAITRAKGELIVTTDGDCRVGPGWIASLVAGYEQTGARLLSGPVTFLTERSLTDYLQTVEFSSLIGSGASSLAMGTASMCNGANLAYQKSVFEEVGGFAGNEHIASGDDEFLMHKVATMYPDGVVFLKNQDAIVQTGAHQSWRAFYRQRKRWASKWKHYNNPLTIALAIYVFACNATLLVVPALCLMGIFSWKFTVGVLLIKWIPEWFFIGSILSFLKKHKTIPFIPLVQMIYPFYVTFFGLAVQKPSYIWKDRTLR